MNSFNDFNSFGSKGIISKITKKQKIAICSGIVVVILAVVLLCARGCSGASSRAKQVQLANFYYESGEYDRALDALQKLFLKNPDDKEIRELMQKIIAEKGDDGSGSGSNITQNYYNNSSSAQDEKSQKVIEELARQNAELARQSAKQNAESARQQKEMAELLRQQQQADKERRAQLKAQEEEEKALAKAAEEQRKKEEAARKAAEEELARKNAKLKAEIASVNDSVQQGKSALNRGSIDEAIKNFAEAQEKLPVSSGEPAFSASKDAEMAGALYDASLNAANPDDKKKLQDAAVDYASKAVALEPKNAESQYILGMDAFDKKNYQKALDHLVSATDNDTKGNYLYWYNLGRVQYMMKKYSGAKSSFSKACQLNGNFAPARYNLGLTNNKLNDSRAALAEFRKAHDIDSRHERSYLEEGRILASQKDYAGAINAYQNVIRINSTNRAALNELGSVYYQSGKYSEAENTFKQSLAMLPAGTDDSMTYYNLSTVLFEEDKVSDALLYAKKAYDSCGQIKNTANRANVIYNYALMSEKSGNTDNAIQKYAEVLQYNPNHLKTQINLGVMYMNMNPPDTETALQLFAKAYSLDKNNFEVNNNLGSAYLSLEDYENAVKYFQNALKIQPKNNEVRYNLGQAFASSKQFDNAKTTYVQVLQQDANNLDAYIELAKVCMALSDNESAEKYLTVVQIKNPSYKKTEVDSLLASIKG